MRLLFLPGGILEIAIFLLAIIAFGLAVRFFINSRKRLQEMFPGIAGPRKGLSIGFDRSGFLIPKTVDKKTGTSVSSFTAPAKGGDDNTKQEIRELRRQFQQQQLELAKALEKIAYIGQQTKAPEHRTALILEEQRRQEALREQLEEKEVEIQRLKQQEAYTQKLQERLEEVQGAFDELQEKMAQVEKQAWQTAELSIQLEHAEQAQLQAEKNLLKKEEKLRELSLEYQELQDSFHKLEDKLLEANRQQLQLQKKIQLLEGLNSDMLQMAEANRKLKTEIARVAELESMLHLISEERNILRR